MFKYLTWFIPARSYNIVRKQKMDTKQIVDIVPPCKKLQSLDKDDMLGTSKLGNNAKIQEESAKLNIMKC